MATIAVLGTLDTKGEEHAFVADQIRARGHQAMLIDVGTGTPPTVVPDVTREVIATSTGLDLAKLSQQADRGACVSAMSKHASLFVEKLVSEKKVDGIISLGGGGGTAIASAVMRSLPIGFPKLIVSTLASGNTAHYVGTNDIAMMPSIVDINGLNRISRGVFARAAGAICGMVDAKVDSSSDKPIVVASMFGNTTQCINIAKGLLEQAGYEVLVFHATGTGGQAMESLIESGLVSGVLDITTTELADELVGGVLSAGPDRMNATANAKVPSIVAPGCMDMVNFGEPSTIPPKFNGRNFYLHNPQVTLMRTNAQECQLLGKMISDKVNAYSAPTTILLPAKAISVVSAPGGPFHDPLADQALFASIRKHLRADIKVVQLDVQINDEIFAKACVEALLRNIALQHSPSV